ncbi:glycoside hydrolase domain-containing protein [Nocardioides mesophilus]|uniref:DUF1906 domain-containing protein n=1 Tax=Nocardioides mesophilus TaxID=433659 RepID=A0A7G9RCG4_9ACTN|nr:glycoside hydrolase domain-containing protein [Nocardioides mesophilus]QNN53289.1 DUF1906 domain-containing protein [Nocardioides mesophilus]
MTSSHVRRAVGAGLTALAAGLAGVLATPPAVAAVRVTPGDFTGYAFDARCAPTQQQMDAWLTSSPFWGAGIYIGGSMQGCSEADQQHLDATWVRRQTDRGWRLLPIWVGKQAPCYDPASTGTTTGTDPGSSTPPDTIDADPADGYAAAAKQGRAEARLAVAAAQALGVATASTVWYDLEAFDVSQTDCRRPALSFLSGWTTQVRKLGFRSGVYSSVSSGIHALDNADNLSPGSYVMPDQVWYAWDNGRADVAIDAKWVRTASWSGARVHQYDLDVPAAYGGVELQIDRSFMSVGRGSVAPKPPSTCGVSIDFADYRTLKQGSTGGQVKALQCLLEQQRRYDGRVDGRFDRDVARAVRSFQSSRGLPVTGKVNARTWTVLLARGSSPVLKRGSASNDVRRLQRTLNVATAADLRVRGVLDAKTSRWVSAYQSAVGLPATGVVESGTWAALHTGRR